MMSQEKRVNGAAVSLETMLAPRERAVAMLRLQGASVQEVAQELGIKPSSVRTTMHRVYQKCGVANLDELRATVVGSVGDDSCSYSMDADECDNSTSFAVQLVVEMCFLLCAPVVLVHILFIYASPVRFNLNDAAAVGLMVLGFFLAMICGPALKRWILARPPWLRAILSVGFAGCFVACMAEVLFMWMLLGYPVPTTGAAHVMAYALCFVVPLLVMGIVSTTRVTSFDVLRAHPLALCITLVIQAIVASWTSIGGAVAAMAFVTAICACVFLFSFAKPYPESGFHPDKSIFDVSDGARPAAARSFSIASIVFGMSLGAASLPSIHGLIEFVACLPSIAVIVCMGYVSHRMKVLSALRLLWRTVLMLGVMGVVAGVSHSYPLGAFIDVAIVLVLSFHTVCIDAALRESARSWTRVGSLLVCLGVLLGVFSIKVFSSSPFDAFDLHSVIAWTFFCVGAALILALYGAHAIWRLCQFLLDAAELGAHGKTMLPGDTQRMRAFLVLQGLNDFECEVVLRTVEGASIQEIANALHYSASSVKAARGRAYRMFDVHDAAGLHTALLQVIIV